MSGEKPVEDPVARLARREEQLDETTRQRNEALAQVEQLTVELDVARHDASQAAARARRAEADRDRVLRGVFALADYCEILTRRLAVVDALPFLDTANDTFEEHRG